MSHVQIQTEEWEVELCDTCGHEQSYHHDGTQDSFMGEDDKMMHIKGCTVCVHGGRRFAGNPWERCTCMEFK